MSGRSPEARMAFVFSFENAKNNQENNKEKLRKYIPLTKQMKECGCNFSYTCPRFLSAGIIGPSSTIYFEITKNVYIQLQYSVTIDIYDVPHKIINYWIPLQ
jgi:hypothetical protein